MDASQYKDYVLTLLFVKYVSDKAKADKSSLIDVPADGSFDYLVTLKGKTNIGEEINKAIRRLAEANELQGVINNADFDDRHLRSTACGGLLSACGPSMSRSTRLVP